MNTPIILDINNRAALAVSYLESKDNLDYYINELEYDNYCDANLAYNYGLECYKLLAYNYSIESMIELART